MVQKSLRGTKQLFDEKEKDPIYVNLKELCLRRFCINNSASLSELPKNPNSKGFFTDLT
jgi:hypothetical protein